MTNFATLNVGKGGAAKLPAIINVFGEMGAHVMALQEIDLNPLSAPGAVNMCRLFGFFLYLGALDALKLAQDCHPLVHPWCSSIQLPVQDPARAAAVAFEFTLEASPCEVSLYGQAKPGINSLPPIMLLLLHIRVRPLPRTG